MAIQRSSRFPNDPVLVRLLESARLSPHQDDQIVHDEYGFDKTYAELLADIVQTRDALRAQLPPSALNVHGLLHEDRPYICALTRGGYEFMVAFFAIRALGGACMSLASGLLVEEAEHFMSMAKATALLTSASHFEQANKTHAFAAQQGSSDFITLCVSSDAAPLSDIDVGINESPELAPDGPGLVLFTSGTTGIPKAAVLPRQCLVFQQAASPGGCVLNYRPPHWRGGLAATILPPLTGMKLWALKQQPSAEDVWEALKSRIITHLIFNPTMLRRMKETYEQKIESLPPDEKAKYLDGFHKIGKIKCNGATIAPTILKFWTDLTGLPFQNGWGSTECGGGITETILHLPLKHKHAVGPLVSDPPVDVKLSEGDHGEFLLKSPWMLIKYLGDEAATQKVFDEQGYLKTGDLGRLVDGEYIFEGRANSDFIERTPRIPLEDALTSFPYVAEVYVLAVPGHEVRDYCAALIRPKKGVDAGEVTLARLHADLADAELPAYIRPYMLRVLDEDEEVPHTLSQKPIWREIVKKFFVAEGRWDGEAPLPGVEIWSSPLGLIYCNDPAHPMFNADAKPWDGGGLQMSN